MKDLPFGTLTQETSPMGQPLTMEEAGWSIGQRKPPGFSAQWRFTAGDGLWI